jgi:hypothetical protein
MNTLKPTQSHVEPLIASIKSFKITSSSNPSKYPQVINCELVVENWLRIDAESSNPINNDHCLELQGFRRLPYNPPFLLKGKLNA